MKMIVMIKKEKNNSLRFTELDCEKILAEG
jgi:hypothetical protein